MAGDSKPVNSLFFSKPLPILGTATRRRYPARDLHVQELSMSDPSAGGKMESPAKTA
jgi:hypothetical protein